MEFPIKGSFVRAFRDQMMPLLLQRALLRGPLPARLADSSPIPQCCPIQSHPRYKHLKHLCLRLQRTRVYLASNKLRLLLFFLLSLPFSAGP